MPDVLKRDQNFVTVAGAITNDVSQDVTMLRVDPTTGYLLVSVSSGAATAASNAQVAKRDQNFVPVCMAWDDTNQVLQEVLTDSDGNLLCDITGI